MVNMFNDNANIIIIIYNKLKKVNIMKEFYN